MTREREGESSGLKGEIRQERKRENWRQKRLQKREWWGQRKNGVVAD